MKRLALILATFAALAAAAADQIFVRAPWHYLGDERKGPFDTAYGAATPVAGATVGPLSWNYISSAGFAADRNREITVRATPPAGYRLDKWMLLADDRVPAETYADITTVRAEFGGDYELTFGWRTAFETLPERCWLSLAPRYVKIVYALTYHPNMEGAWEEEDGFHEYDEEVTLADCPFTRKGYEFAGWSLATNGPAAFASGETVTGAELAVDTNAVADLYAVWEKFDITVALDANGGAASKSAVTVRIDEPYDLPDAVRPGFAFAGWYTYPTGGRRISSGEPVADPAITNLFARWTAAECVIRTAVTGDGAGTVTPDPATNVTAAFGAEVPLSAEAAPGSRFVAWQDGCTTPVRRVKAAGDAVYTAEFARAALTVTFGYYDALGERAACDVRVLYGDDATPPSPSVCDRRPGYRLTGWGDGYRAVTNDGVTVEAVYARGRYSLAYDANAADATGATAGETDLEQGASVTLAANGFTRTGYVFAGWARTPSATVPDFAALASVPAPAPDGISAVTLYAVWEPVSYTVAFDANGGSGTMASLDLRYGEPRILPPNAFTCPPLGFRGWTTDPMSSEVEFADLDAVSDLTAEAGATVTLYALWRGGYAVRFHDADGTSGAVQQFALGVAQRLNPCAFDALGRRFAGWADAPGSTTVVQSDRAAVTDLAGLGETVDLYAVWDETAEYTVRFDPNGGWGAMAPRSYAVGDTTATLPANAFEGPGTFLGWATTPDGAKAYDDGATPAEPLAAAGRGVTLYALWQSAADGWTAAVDTSLDLAFSETYAGTASVTTDAAAEGGTCVSFTVPDETEQYGAYARLDGEVTGKGTLVFRWKADRAMTFATVRGLQFAYRDKNGLMIFTIPESVPGNGVYEEMRIPFTADTTVFSWISYWEEGGYTASLDDVRWIPESFKVIYHANSADATGTMSDGGFSHAEDAVNTLAACGFENGAGSAFLGWATTPGGAVVFADGEEVGTIDDAYLSASGNLDLYAVWGPGEWTLAFATDGGADAAAFADVAVAVGDAVTLPAEAPVRDGFVFLGWAEASGAAAPDFLPGEEVTLTVARGEVKCLYAVWAAAGEIRLHRGAADAEGSMAGVAVLPPATSVTLPACAFTRGSCAFLGWAETSGGAVVYADKAAVPASAAGSTLYAVWGPGEWNLAFDANGGTTGADPAPAVVSVVGEDAAIPSFAEFGKVVRKGYVFLGWAANPSAAEAEFACGGTYPADGIAHDAVRTLYAVWRKATGVTPPVATPALVYTGAAQTGVVAHAGCTVDGGVSAAAGLHAATVTLAEGFFWADGEEAETRTVEWEIAPAIYDMSGVSLPAAVFVADGTAKSLALAGALPAGVSVTYAGNGKTAAGEYEVTASFTGDAVNYRPIPDLTSTLTILAAEDPEVDPDEPGDDDPDGPGGDPDEPGDPEEPDDPDVPDPPPVDDLPTLHPTGAIGEFTAEKAATYVGWLKNADGTLYATLQVKTTAAKAGRDSKATIAVTPLGGKKKTVKAVVTPGGNPTDAYGIVYGALGLGGTFEGRAVQAAQDFSKAKLPAHKALLAEIPVGVTTMAVGTPAGVATFSVTVSNKGKAKVAGVLADGQRLSLTVVGSLGERHFAVPVAYAKKGGPFALVLWIPLAGTSGKTCSLPADWTALAVGANAPPADGRHVFGFEVPAFRDYIAAAGGSPVTPDGEAVVVAGAKWTTAKTVGKPVLDKATGEVTLALKAGVGPANVAGLKLKYTAKTGVVKGSFALYHLLNGKLKKDTVAVNGVVVDGRFYGSGSVKKAGTFGVWTE